MSLERAKSYFWENLFKRIDGRLRFLVGEEVVVEKSRSIAEKSVLQEHVGAVDNQAQENGVQEQAHQVGPQIAVVGTSVGPPRKKKLLDPQSLLFFIRLL